MKKIIMAALITATATGAMAGGPHYSKKKCRQLVTTSAATGASAVFMWWLFPVAIGSAVATQIGCDHLYETDYKPGV